MESIRSQLVPLNPLNSLPQNPHLISTTSGLLSHGPCLILVKFFPFGRLALDQLPMLCKVW